MLSNRSLFSFAFKETKSCAEIKGEEMRGWKILEEVYDYCQEWNKVKQRHIIVFLSSTVGHLRVQGEGRNLAGPMKPSSKKAEGRKWEKRKHY